LRLITLQGFPVVSVSPNLLGFEVILSWSWLLSGVCPTFDRPVCSSPFPTLAGQAATIHQQASLRPRLALLRFLLPSALPAPSAPCWWDTSPPDPPSGFLNLLTVYAASGLRGLVSCRLRSRDSPLRAFPFQKAVLLSKPLLPCGWAPARAFALYSWPSFPGFRLVRLACGRVRGWSLSKRASSFIGSPTLLFRLSAVR